MLPFGTSQAHRRERILDYLRKHAPYSVADRASALANGGHVTECVRGSDSIFGAVRDGDVFVSCSLLFNSANSAEARCSCSRREELAEQWCSHVSALYIRAHELGFFDDRGGFEAPESTFRSTPQTARELARCIESLDQTVTAPVVGTGAITDEISLVLDASGDRLGVQFRLNDSPQTPALFEGFFSTPHRSLDRLFLALLDDAGAWDDDDKFWFINSSRSLEAVIGLLTEYPRVVDRHTGRPIKVARSSLNARIILAWSKAALDVSMSWVLPDGSEAPRRNDLIGTGPHWSLIEDTIYPLSATASLIGSLFPHGSPFSLPRAQVAPVLETLARIPAKSELITIVGAEVAPKAEVREPIPNLNFEMGSGLSGRYSGDSAPQLTATLSFEYPANIDDCSTVILPHRAKEREHMDALVSLGFQPGTSSGSYSMRGEDVLDFIHHGHQTLLEAPWKLSGFDQVRRSVRFVDLSLDVRLKAQNSEASAKSGTTSSGSPRFECQVSLLQNNAHVPISLLFRSSRPDSEKWIALDSGSYARVPGGTLESLRAMLGVLDPNFKLSNSIKASLSSAQAVGFTRSADASIRLSVDKQLAKLSERLEHFSSITLHKESREFAGELRLYQREGLSWINFLREFELGGILADEMGLGKTVQTLAFLQHLLDSGKRSERGSPPSMVVAPTSVITNWLYEARRFTPKLKVLLLHGPGRKALFRKIPQHDLIITSYALLRIDRNELERFDFGHLILDEAQNIKNPDAATTKAAKSLKSRHRMALTGTPTENRPLELWSIFDFLMPGYLGSPEFFKNHIERPIMEQGVSCQAARILRAKTRPFILRRKKQDVEKELPPKVESVLHVDMAESQRDLYQAILAEVRPKVFDAVAERGVRGASVSILAALLRLRQVCNHPNSIEALKDLSGYDSGKFTLLKELVLEAIASDRKILLFCQFREMLLIIRRFLESEGISFLYLDGSTRDRQELVDRFNSEPEVKLFLISLKAGGTGLNLASADTVILYDPWWNPAVEHQAVDRAHRIGQRKTVSVYRLVTENSVEQRIMELKATKSKIVDALVGGDESLSVGKLSKKDLEYIFSPIASSEDRTLEA